jgi:hypothetical protein
MDSRDPALHLSNARRAGGLRNHVGAVPIRTGRFHNAVFAHLSRAGSL